MKKFIAISIGCLECKYETEVYGAFDTKEEADKAMKERKPLLSIGGRYGQSNDEVFEIEV